MSESTEETPFAGEYANYTLQMFAEDVRAELAPAGIETRVDESEDGTRTVSAWPTADPDAVSVFPIDEVRILPYQAHLVATAIRRSVAAPQPSDQGA